MPVTTIKKYQIDYTGTNAITNTEIAAAAAIATTKLADGAEFFKRDGSVTATGNHNQGGFRITNLGDGVAATDAVTVQQLQNAQLGIDYKESVRAATTANIALTGTQTVDGVVLVAGNRILVKDQTTGSANGIYVVAAGAWTRATDADSSADVTSGMITYVEEGTTNGQSQWVLSNSGAIVLNTTALVFVQFSGAGQITAGAGMTKNGNTLDVVTASTSRIVVNANDIDLATTGVAASTYRSVTVDVYGRVTAGTNPTTLAGYGITDAQGLDADLTAIAGVSTTGILVRTGAGTATTRTLSTASSARITVTNGDGVSGNPTLDLATTVTAGTAMKITYDVYGRVTAGATASLSDLSNVVLTTPTNGQLLQYNGTNWVNASLNTVVSSAYVTRETPSGTINGTNAIFVLANNPVTGQESVYVNGVLQNGASNDYSIQYNTPANQATITFQAGAVPPTGSVILVNYFKA
jgi:hypothetical protein